MKNKKKSKNIKAKENNVLIAYQPPLVPLLNRNLVDKWSRKIEFNFDSEPCSLPFGEG